MLESEFRLARRGRAVAILSCLGPVAQLAEQQTLNLRVVGSIPTRLNSSRSRSSWLTRWLQALKLRSSTSPFGHDSLA